MDTSLWQTFGELFAVLGQLLIQLLALAGHWLLLIVWVAWWLLAVNWQKAWPVLRSGGWAPLVLLMLMVALAWSRLQAVRYEIFDLSIANFVWQLAAVCLLVALTLFCGWLQGVFRCVPPEINLEPPVAAHADGHAHGAHH
jgi:hypothetical protein